jgi:DNA invertase Pin-like site-specific DNA recombinase
MKNQTELKTAAAYIRVSTDNQTELSPASQIKTIQQYAKQHGYIVPKEFIFRDDGISGRRADKRPEFVKMIATAKNKPSPFSAILLWKFSRFARNQEESIFYKAQLRKNGVEVVSVSEPVIEGPFGTLIERIIEWSDEYYSIRLSGEVKRGMLEKVERGGAVSVPAFGYDIKDKKYVVNPDTAPIVRQIFNDFLNGKGTRQIATHLNELKIKTTRGNEWENRTVEYILYNPVYIGKIRWNPKGKTKRNYNNADIMIVEGQHEPIIDVDTFEKVQKQLAIRKKQHAPYVHQHINEDYMLHGLVKCSDCGRSLAMAVRGTSLQCIGYAHGHCSVSHSISINKINTMVITAIEQAFETGCFNLTVKDINQVQKPSIDIPALIDKEQLKLKRITEAYEDGVYTLDEYKERRQLVSEQIENLKAQLPTIQPESNSELSRKLINSKKNVISLLKSKKLSESEKNAILRSFIDKIVFDRTNSSIEIFFYI